MSFAHLFASYWWLIFPVFGMAMGAWGMASSERRAQSMMDLIKSYVDQGKDPPPELLRLAAQGMEENASKPQQSRQSGAWSFVVFAAMAAGFGAGYYLVRAEDYSFAFLIVAVVMGVMALGALVLLLLGRKS